MALTVEDAYTQIKNLENTGKITLPRPQGTVVVGTIDAASGVFTWSVPVTDQTMVMPPVPPQKTNSILTIPAGVVQTDAVDLRLKFLIKNARTRPTTEARLAGSRSAGLISGVEVDFPTGIEIQGFPTLVSNQSEIIVDAGLACSQVLQSPTITPPMSRFDLSITVPGQSQAQNLHLFIVRPPVLGFGAFTIPALPLTLIYTPPQGKLQKNFAQYSDTVTVTRTMTSSFTTSNNTKTAQAYSAGDLLSKGATLITDAAALVAAGAAGGAAGAGGAGAAGAGADAGSAGDALKGISSGFKLFGDILSAVGDTTTTTNTATLTVESDHSVSVSWSDMNTFGTKTALGPGVGDRFVYMNNVRVVWMAINGEVALHILGYEKIRADTAQTLLADEAALAAGSPTVTGLDLQSLRQLLALDPFCIHRRAIAVFEPPLIGPPRFVAANPPEQAGTGTSPSGDQISATYEITTEDKQVQTSIDVTVTDVKPGWLDVVFGDPNTETTTTMTVTVGQTSDTKTDEKITDTATFFSAGADDPYDVKIFYDRLFGTLVFVDRNSAALAGGAVLRAGTFSAGGL